jgi:hypothetical protein
MRFGERLPRTVEVRFHLHIARLDLPCSINIQWGAADCVVVACLREFDAERRVKFQLSLAIVVALDCALEVAHINIDCAEEV